MLKVINKLLSKTSVLIIVLTLLTVPTFYRMIKPGIYSMQDFHFFRLFEFNKCVQIGEIPCRWAPDAGLGYGEPLFNFYGQFVYAIGELFHLIGFSLIDSLKMLFILSLVGSAITMYFLSKRIWNNSYAAFLSALIYVYAPYRAVDVWVRGALPEAFSFVILPLIFLFIDKYLENKKVKDLLLFSLITAILIITHNLSFVMFMPVVLVWSFYRVYINKDWKLLFNILLSLLVSFLLSSFYILPVIFESKFIDIASTTVGYFDYRAHFATISQIFLSRYWGYGGSTWGMEDGLSLAVGQIQWMLPLSISALILINKNFRESKNFFVILFMGLLFLLLTHNKSTFIWNNIPGMAYIQFPWRFLGMATFCLALSSGYVFSVFKKSSALLLLLLSTLVIGMNVQFYREDIWYSVGDSYFTTGDEWDRQRAASIHDYWPKLGHEIPSKPGDGTHINYFPGWVGKEAENKGLILAEGAKFNNTPIRKVGNTISLFAILGTVIYLIKIWKK